MIFNDFLIYFSTTISKKMNPSIKMFIFNLRIIQDYVMFLGVACTFITPHLFLFLTPYLFIPFFQPLAFYLLFGNLLISAPLKWLVTRLAVPKTPSPGRTECTKIHR